MDKIITFSELTKQIEQLEQLVEQEFEGLDVAVLNRREAPNRWSMLECVEHLNRYSQYYHQEIQKGLGKIASSSAKQPKLSWLGKKSIKAVDPKNQKKQTTYKKMNPQNSSLSHTVLQEFLQHQRVLKTLIKKAQQLNYNKKKVRIEFFKLLRLSVYETIVFLVLHQQRHIQQAKRLQVLFEPKGDSASAKRVV